MDTRVYRPAGGAGQRLAVEVEARSIDAPVWKTGSLTGAGTIVSWVPGNGRRARVLLMTVSATAAATVAFQENTGTISAPVWTVRIVLELPAQGSAALGFPDQSFGPAGDGVGGAVRLQAISGTGTHRGTLHGYEV